MGPCALLPDLRRADLGQPARRWRLLLGNLPQQVASRAPRQGRGKARAYREAAGLVVHGSCIQCGKPLPDGSNARRKFCSDACNTANYRARKANGHANGQCHDEDDRRPQPTLDPMVPEVENACLRIALEFEPAKREHPEITPRQALQEARRRSATTMIAAADAIEAKRARQRLQDGRG